MDIQFLGYHADDKLITAYENRTEYMDLDEFYSAVNSSEGGYRGRCSCCKRDCSIYAVDVVYVPLIKPAWLSICVECVRRLPRELILTNLSNNRVPPVLRLRD